MNLKKVLVNAKLNHYENSDVANGNLWATYYLEKKNDSQVILEVSIKSTVTFRGESFIPEVRMDSYLRLMGEKNFHAQTDYYSGNDGDVVLYLFNRILVDINDIEENLRSSLDKEILCFK